PRSRQLRPDLPSSQDSGWRRSARASDCAQNRRLRFLRQSFVIAAKDLRAELRGKETINASLSFSLVILLLFSFAFDPSAVEPRAICGGLLWLVFAFAGALVLNRSFAR